MKKLKTDEVIQKVAGDLFRKFGFDKTSMDDIARRAHKAKRSIYNHFNNKEEIFSAGVRQEVENIRARLLEAISNEQELVLPRLRRYLLLRMELFADAGMLQVAMKNNMLSADDHRFEDLKNIHDGFAAWEHGLFKRVWYAKPTTDTLEVVEQQAVAFADMLHVTLNGLTHSFFVEGKYEQYKSSYEMLIDLIVNSVFQSFTNQFVQTQNVVNEK